MKRFLTTAILMLMAAGAAVAQCSDADRAALQAFDGAWSKAGQSGDRSVLTAIYADDYTGLPGMQGKASTIDNTIRTFERNKANPQAANDVKYDHYAISCTPLTATITHRNVVTTKVGAGGNPETFHTRSIHFLEKRNGKWQVVSNTSHDVDDYMALGYLEEEWNAAALKRDKGWFDRNYAADYTSVSSGSAALMTKSEDISDIVDDKGTVDWNGLSNMNIRIEGNTAIVTGINHVKGKDEKGAAYDRRVRFTDTWIKRDGRWQVWASQGTRMPAQPTGTTAVN